MKLRPLNNTAEKELDEITSEFIGSTYIIDDDITRQYKIYLKHLKELITEWDKINADGRYLINRSLYHVYLEVSRPLMDSVDKEPKKY